jgi:hypothetical protein
VRITARPQAARACERPAVDLTAVLAVVVDLQQRVAALEGQRRPRPDPDRDARLLSAIAFAVGGQVFTASDLHQRGAHDPALATALDGADVRRLGLWLRRLARHDGAAGYRLRRSKRGNSGQMWEVRC